jgi:hypothetical protein
MRTFTWIPIGLVVGFIVGSGVPAPPDPLHVLGLAAVAIACILILGAGAFEGRDRG